ERALADQQPDQYAPVEIGKLVHAAIYSSLFHRIEKRETASTVSGWVGRPERAQSTSGATTRRRSGSWPSLSVSTSWRLFRCSWTTFRSSALIASRATGRLSWIAASAACSAAAPRAT